MTSDQRVLLAASLTEIDGFVSLCRASVVKDDINRARNRARIVHGLLLAVLREVDAIACDERDAAADVSLAVAGEEQAAEDKELA